MTQTQELQYAKALVRAQSAGIHVVGRGYYKASGHRFILVSSATSSIAHTVRIVGNTLVCDCKAAINRQYCQHRAVARQSIEEVAHKAAAVLTVEEATIMLRTPAGPRMYR
jgi:hypothetical protein